jgi:hypothetical protein
MKCGTETKASIDSSMPIDRVKLKLVPIADLVRELDDRDVIRTPRHGWTWKETTRPNKQEPMAAPSAEFQQPATK